MFFFLSAWHLSGQIGIALSYRYFDAPHWGELLGENETLFKNGHGFHADYRFSLKEANIDLIPEFGFTIFSNQIPAIGDYSERFFIAQFFDFQGNANIYPFDLFRNFSGRSNLNVPRKAARAIFVQVSTGVSMAYLSYRAALEDMLLPPRRTVASLGIGTGFHLRYRNYLTLTPMLRYRHYPNVTWPGLSELRDENSGFFLRDDTYINQIAFSLRLEVTLKGKNGEF